ncbi:MAG: right-handed parallel beta-helix repeat-containing protein, partial [Planctomycetota bacterium]
MKISIHVSGRDQNPYPSARVGSPAVRSLSPSTALVVYGLLMALPTTASGQTTWIVDQAGGGDFLAIQEGIDAASNGDMVLVADGTYTGAGNKDLDFGGKAITVESRTGPDNCIIDGEGNGRGVFFHNAEGPDSVLEGFTIKRFDRNGILIQQSDPTISNCRILENTVWDPNRPDGAGILVNGHPTWHASPLITNCTIRHFFNDTSTTETYTYECSPTIQNCDISFNQAMTGGGVAVYTGNP